MPPAFRNPQKLMVFVFSSLYGRPSLSPAVRNPQKLKAAMLVLALNKAHVLALNTADVLRLNKADVLALNKAHVLRLNTKICLVFTANAQETTKALAAPPLWRRPKAASFVLAVNIGHIFVLRRKTCALLRAKTSALLRRKTSAVLRVRTCVLFRANTEVAAFGRPHLWFPLYWL